jgi:hypothetical protein
VSRRDWSSQVGTDLLDRDTFSRCVVRCRAHDTVSSLSQLFRNVISLIYDELLVEDLEDLSALEIRRHSGAGVERSVWNGESVSRGERLKPSTARAESDLRGYLN